MRNFIFLLAVLLWVVQGCESPSSGETAPVLGIEYADMDTAVDPSEDFYHFANGTWFQNVEIPGDKSGWGIAYKLNEDNEHLLHGILETALSEKTFKKGSDEYKAALFYKVGMDSAQAESVGTKPLKPWLEKISKVEDLEGLQTLLQDFELRGMPGLFSFSVYQDARNNKVNALHLGQSGISLPDRDYYLKDDPKSKEIREAYLSHISKMLTLTGATEADAQRDAETILTFETQLAAAFKSRLEMRNPVARYNKMSIADLQSLNPAIQWETFLSGLGLPDVDSVIVSSPQYLEALATLLTDKTDAATWQPYLRWQVITGLAAYMNKDLVDENFAFFSTKLSGVEEMEPRWKRVLGITNRALGEPMGKLFVAKTFPPEAKADMKEMVENIRKALGSRIDQLEWMSDGTKVEARKKLESIGVKIGYPDKWEDYQDLVVGEESYADNILKVREYNTLENLKEYGQAPDPTEWPFPPQIVNAGYSPINNDITFPAGILQPPFYDFGGDPAANYGSIGSIIGHEITHGFDDSGRRFDAEGNLRDWWTAEDDARFKERAQVMVEQFNQYAPLDSMFVNGELTLGENIADLGGLLIAYDAFQLYQKENPGIQKDINGYSPDQRFFISFGQNWRATFREEAIRQRIMTDVHSPHYFRAIGTLANTQPFFEAFAVPSGKPMRRDDSVLVRIW